MLKALLLFILVSISASSWAFYPPSEESQSLFTSLKGKGNEVEIFLKQQITEASNYSTTNYIVRMKKVPKAAGRPPAEWVPIIEPGTGKLVVELQITAEGLKSPLVMAEEIMRLNQIQSGTFNHPYQWAETVANAKAGSIRATEKLARMDVQNARDIKAWLDNNMSFFPDGTDPAKIEEWSKARIAESQKRYDPIMKAAKAETKKLETEWDKNKPSFDRLERQNKKFNDLVMANDRVGARKMLEKYLPWPLMEPLERNAWKGWLDAMENPDLSRRQVVFRGMDGYPVLETPGSNKVGMFSTVLSRNQGNYTRRLRSLTTSRNEVGRSNYYDVDVAGAPKFPKDEPSVLVQMSSHASSPQASPFISVSDNITASGFGNYERMALLVDERRLVPNAMAFGFGEKERLIPLVVFPDEVVYYHPKAADGTAIDNEKFLANVSEALGRPLTPKEIHYEIETSEFIQRGYKEFVTPFIQSGESSLSGAGCVVGLPCDCITKGFNKLLSTP